MRSGQTSTDNFANEFLKQYLKGGIGAMPKADIDALVMHLLDKYASENGRPLGSFPNQIASERLRAPLARIKRLRYEGSLKFGGRPEDEARIRFVRLLAKTGLELDKKDGTITKIVFVVEDILAKNWIQGQIKEHSGIFDGSFNTEIVKVDPELFFRLLRTRLPDSEIDTFEEKYKTLVKKAKREELVSGFKSLVSSFVKGAAGAGGAAATTALLALPLIGG
ncbi:MAG: hypothetical protein IPI21_16050 [Propionivibrio sp.]|nr:hypothetical protein [Propionivibrio sp.]